MQTWYVYICLLIMLMSLRSRLNVLNDHFKFPSTHWSILSFKKISHFEDIDSTQINFISLSIGIIIGAMLIPIVLAVGDTLGGSSSYCTIVSQLLVTKSMETKVPYLAGFKRGIANWWQVRLFIVYLVH